MLREEVREAEGMMSFGLDGTRIGYPIYRLVSKKRGVLLVVVVRSVSPCNWGSKRWRKAGYVAHGGASRRECMLIPVNDR